MAEKNIPERLFDPGLVQLYTGDGKGKTTAALGLTLRVSGHGGKVAFIQFMKGWDFYGDPTLSVWIWETAWLWDFSFRELAFCHYEGTIRLEAG